MNILFCLFLFLGSSYQEERKDRMFSLFNVVKFKNSGCQSKSTADLQGVCYTKTECEDGGGTVDGNCAAGFGSCCIFIVSGTTASCGGDVSRNCSYIENPEYPATRATAGNCAFTVTRCSSDICQIRLDFKTTSQLASPAAATGVCGENLVVTPGAQNQANLIPTLCGTLTGMHMYVDAGSASTASTLTFTTVAGGTKSWRIKVSQIECSSATRAPNGCLQYFTGTTNTVKSYNWDGSAACAPGCQLANQDYNVCFRTEAGMCGINYTPTTVDAGSNAFDTAVKTVGDVANNNAQQGPECAMNNAGVCGMAVANTCSFIQIPNSNPAAAVSDTYCGDELSGDADAVVSAVITSNLKPFRFRHAVIGNSAQIGGGALAGFSIDATQVPC